MARPTSKPTTTTTSSSSCKGGRGACKVSSCCGKFLSMLRTLLITAAVAFYCYTVLSAAGMHCLKQQQPKTAVSNDLFCKFVVENKAVFTQWASPMKSHAFQNEPGVKLVEHNLTVGLVVPMMLSVVVFMWVVGNRDLTQDVTTVTGALLLVHHVWYSQAMFVLPTCPHLRELGVAIAAALLLYRTPNRCASCVFSLVAVCVVGFYLFLAVVEEHPALQGEVAKHTQDVQKMVLVAVAAVRKQIAELGAKVAKMMQ
eukprot:PhM_4_TR4501/c0_g1_i1/m.50452